MKLVFTLGELIDMDKWDKICKLRGMNPEYIKQIPEYQNKRVVLEEYEAHELGFRNIRVRCKMEIEDAVGDSQPFYNVHR